MIHELVPVEARLLPFTLINRQCLAEERAGTKGAREMSQAASVQNPDGTVEEIECFASRGRVVVRHKLPSPVGH